MLIWISCEASYEMNVSLELLLKEANKTIILSRENLITHPDFLPMHH